MTRSQRWAALASLALLGVFSGVLLLSLVSLPVVSAP